MMWEERAKDTVTMIPQDVRSILDVGCGDGLVTNKLAGEIVVGIDISRVALMRVSQEKALGSAESLPFKSRSFDLVLAAELLEHLERGSLEMVIGEMKRVAKRYILVTTPDKEYPFETFVRCAECGEIYSGVYHVNFFNEEKLQELLGPRDSTVGHSGKFKHFYFLRRLGQKAFQFYSHHESALCPRCGSGKTRETFASRLFDRFVGFLQTRFPTKKRRWILFLANMNNRNGYSEPLL